MGYELTSVHSKTFAIAIGAAALFSVTGCGPESLPQDSEQTSKNAEPLTVDYDFTDWSGEITSRIRVCAPSGYEHWPTATCTLSSDFVLTGGGAEVVGSNASPGALLYASWPVDWDSNTWEARSKDHEYPQLHQVRAFAVGIKIAGVSADSLRAQRRIDVGIGNCDWGHYKSAYADWTGGRILTATGGYADWYGAGQMLTRLSDGQARSKDSVYSDVSGCLWAYAISLPYVIEGYGPLDFGYTSASASVSTGYGQAVAGPKSGYVLTGIDGYAGSLDRFLTKMVPSDGFGPGAAVTSKDHGAVSGGTVQAHAFWIEKP